MDNQTRNNKLPTNDPKVVKVEIKYIYENHVLATVVLLYSTNNAFTNVGMRTVVVRLQQATYAGCVLSRRLLFAVVESNKPLEIYII